MQRPVLPVALTVLALAGCYRAHDGSDILAPADGGVIARDGGIGRDGGGPPPPPPPPPPPTGNSYVIAELSIPEPTGRRAPGANVDGVDSGEGRPEDPSATCQDYAADYRSIADDTRGVDDQYGVLVPTLEGLLGRPVDDVVREAILGGRLLVVITLHETGDVDVQLAAARDIPFHDGRRLEPGNTMTVIAPLGRGIARAVGGRTVASIDSFAGMIPAGLIPLLPLGFLQQVELRFDHTAEGLLRGELGGSFRVEDAVAESGAIMPGIEDTVRSVLESLADVRPTDDPEVCERVSVGMSFEAVPVFLVR